MHGGLLDLLLIVLVIAFGISGYRQGFIVGLLSFVGFVGGGVLGILIAPPITTAVVSGDAAQSLMAVTIVFLTAMAGQFASSTLGAVVRSRVRWEPARLLDALGGTLAGGLSILVIAWMMGSLLVTGPLTPVVDQIRGSILLSAVDQAVPAAAKKWQQPFRRFADRSGFPPVLDLIDGKVGIDVSAPNPAVLRRAGLGRARPGIVQIRGQASSCDTQIEGTGFVFAPDHIMTNAHVVAGVDAELQIFDQTRQPRSATVVFYNPRRDVAVLYVPNLNLPLLTFKGPARKGDDAIIAGYPKDKGFTAAPARVADRDSITGPDIYLETELTRDTYLIRGQVLPGNSGGPLLTPEGEVLGMVFAAIPDQRDAGYVLTASELASDARDSATATNPVSTQSCD